MNSRRIAFAAGLAGLAMLPAWDAVLSLPAQAADYRAVLQTLTGTFLVAVAVLVLPGLCSAGSSGTRHWGGRALQASLVFVLASLYYDCAWFLVTTLKDEIAFLVGSRYGAVRWLALVLSAVGAAAVARLIFGHGWMALLRAARDAVALLAPLPILLCASSIWALRGSEPEHFTRTEGVRRTTVVLIFDELDVSELGQSMGRLPSFARLEQTALRATRMYPPANYTSESLPAMLTGEQYSETLYSARQVHMRLPGGDWLTLDQRPSLVSDALGRKAAVGVVGWHLPYCAMYPAVARCWDDAAYRAPGAQVGLAEWLLGHSRFVTWVSERWLASKASDLEAYSKAFFATPSFYRLHHIGSILEQQRQQVLELVRSRQFDLVFAHLACPHPPSVDPAELGRVGIFEAYEHNLRVCDEVLSDVWKELEGGAANASFALVVSSDHWFRGLDWRDQGRPGAKPSLRRPVPFYVQIGRESGALQSTDVLSNSRVLRRLLAELSRPECGYGCVKAAVDAQGDGETALRPF